jgi:hypothetical protein
MQEGIRVWVKPGVAETETTTGANDTAPQQAQSAATSELAAARRQANSQFPIVEATECHWRDDARVVQRATPISFSNCGAGYTSCMIQRR